MSFVANKCPRDNLGSFIQACLPPSYASNCETAVIQSLSDLRRQIQANERPDCFFSRFLELGSLRAFREFKEITRLRRFEGNNATMRDDIANAYSVE